MNLHESRQTVDPASGAAKLDRQILAEHIPDSGHGPLECHKLLTRLRKR
jgi:hypothetical protein